MSHGFKSRGECGPEELEAAQAFAPEATRALFAGIGNGERLIALSGALRAQSGGGVVADAALRMIEVKREFGYFPR
mgnify:CR=1 FL=1